MHNKKNTKIKSFTFKFPEKERKKEKNDTLLNDGKSKFNVLKSNYFVEIQSLLIEFNEQIWNIFNVMQQTYKMSPNCTEKFILLKINFFLGDPITILLSPYTLCMWQSQTHDYEI